jgi:hypothetical protein
MDIEVAKRVKSCVDDLLEVLSWILLISVPYVTCKLKRYDSLAARNLQVFYSRGITFNLQR